MTLVDVSNSTQWREITSYSDCFAQSHRDPDVQGYAVRLSIYVANVCLSIIMTWSTEDVKESVFVVFMQTYTILLATFVSLARRTLSIADAHFALTITVSPLSVYFMYSTTRYFLNRHSNLYSRLGVGHTTVWIAGLSVGLCVQWLIILIVIYGAPDHVFRGERCSTTTLVGWLFYEILSLALLLSYSVVFVTVFPLMYIVYTLRHIKDIHREFKRHQVKVKKWRSFRFVQWPSSVIRSWTLSNWIVVTYSHHWMIFLLVLIAYTTWGSGVGAWIPDMGLYWNEILKDVHAEQPDGWPDYVPDPDFDPYSFGQLLAATVALEPLYQVIKLTIRRRRDILSKIKAYPKSLWNGIVFVFSGRGNPWHRILNEREERGADIEDPAVIPLHPKWDFENITGRGNKSEEDVYSPHQLNAYHQPSLSFHSSS